MYRAERKDGLAASISFDPKLLDEFSASDPEDLPSWIWMQKLFQVCASIGVLIEGEGLNKSPEIK